MYVNQTGNFTHDFKMCSYEQLTRLHNASLEVPGKNRRQDL